MAAQAQTTPQPGDALTELPHHVLDALPNASPRARAAAAGDEPISLTIVLQYADRLGLDAFVRNLDAQPPASRRFLSPSELATRFGPSQESYDAVVAYLTSFGFRVTDGSANRLTVTVAGTRSQAEQAFNTTIADYQLGDRIFRANVSNPRVPASVGRWVQAVSGLSNLARPHPMLAQAQAGQPLDGQVGASAVVAVDTTPMAIATAYNAQGVTGATGSGQKIGLLEYDTFQSSDVSLWLNLVGLPAGRTSQLSEVKVDGGVTSSTSTGRTEVLLDIDTVMGIAPAATYISYAAPFSTSFQTLFNKMIQDNVDVISVSWGICESDTTAADVNSMDAVLAGAKAAGIAVFTASGDTEGTCRGNTNHANDADVPAILVNQTGVGGTTLGVNDNNGTYAVEAWWGSGALTPTSCQGSLCSGGGFAVSKFLARPSFQDGFTSSATRSTPDVSADADPSTGIVICVDGTCNQNSLHGGTSMAAPIWSAGMALINQKLGHRVGNLNTVLYSFGNTTAFHRPSGMLSPDNDFAHVGLGSFDLGLLFTAISGAPLPPTSTPSLTPTITLTPVPGADNATAMSTPAPATVAPGQEVDIPVFFLNSGSTTWTTAGGYTLKIVGGQSIALGNCDPRAPGQQCNFTLSFNTSQNPAPVGSYTFNFRMQHNSTLFGDTITANIVVTSSPGATSTPTATPPITLTPTRTSTPTATLGPTSTPTPTNTPSPTSTLTAVITLTPTATLTRTLTPTPTLTVGPTSSLTAVPTFTATQTPTSTPTQTASPSPTASATPTATATTVVSTPTRTATATATSAPATVTSTPGSTPSSGATLNGSMTFQGLTFGTSGYQLGIEVRLFQPGTSNQLASLPTTTDVNGAFSVTGISPGIYDVEVKEAHRVGRIARNLSLLPGTNVKAFGDLVAGDTNGDDIVSLVDYSRMRASFGKCQGDTGFQPLADFNGDTCVSLADYSRLRANFGVIGPLNAP